MVNIDLYGQISSESSGIRHISWREREQDFVMGAYLSKILCLRVMPSE